MNEAKKVTRRNQRYRIRLVAAALAGSLVACSPVIAVGWGEILILLLVVTLVVGPLLLRFFRAQKNKQIKKKDQKED
ncbi:MAG: hypothetical protein E4H33_01750 [Anaerolineales bacterium]|nr:MAG: hypothetical protein E4H33_01750 [Anaerolineales bacterium]